MSDQDWQQALQHCMQSDLQLAGVGCFAQVIKVGDTGLVVKRATSHPVVGDLQPIEKPIYERLGHHPSILRYYGEHSGECVAKANVGDVLNGLVFEYVPGGLLSDNMALVNCTEERAESVGEPLSILEWPSMDTLTLAETVGRRKSRKHYVISIRRMWYTATLALTIS